MRDILLLFRYISITRTRKSRDSSRLIFTLLTYIAIALGFGIPLSLLVWSILKGLFIPLSSLGLEGSGFIADIFISLSFISMSFLFILSYIPTVIFNLYDSNDIPLLLSLPIRRSSIFIFKSLDSLVYSIPTVGAIIPIAVAYSIGVGKGFFFGLLGSIFYIAFLILLSLLLSAFLSRLFSRTHTRILANLFSLLTIMFYFIIMNLLRPDVTTIEGIKRFIFNNYAYLSGSISYYTPIKWLIMMLRGEPLGYAITVGMSLIIGIFLYLSSNRLVFESNFHKRSKKTYFTNKGFPLPVLKKDIKLVLRDPQSIYMTIYSLIFPLVVSMANRSYIYGPMIMSMISSFYCAYISVTLLRFEHRVWPLPRSFPLRVEDILIWKVLIPFSLYSILYTIFILILVSFFRLNPLIWITLPMISLVFFYSGLFGIRLFLKSPKRATQYKNVFTPLEVLLLEGVTIGLALGIVLPVSLYIKGVQNVLILFIPFGVTIGVISLSLVSIRQTLSVLRDWE